MPCESGECCFGTQRVPEPKEDIVRTLRVAAARIGLHIYVHNTAGKQLSPA